MARPLRLEFAGALYHVTSRGDRREDIYDDDSDRSEFLAILGDVCERFNWVCHAYCLMSNHYHLLIETPDANLSKGMRQLNGVYTQTYNRAHSKVGHLFQGRYKAIHVEKESYLLELARYIVLNPVRAKMVRSAKDWKWSSYRATVGQADCPTWLHTEWLLAAFAKTKGVAINRYKQFIKDGKGQSSPLDSVSGQVYLGSESFIENMKSLIDADKQLNEIPSSQRRAKPKELQYYEAKYQNRNSAICEAYKSDGYTLEQLGNYFVKVKGSGL